MGTTVYKNTTRREVFRKVLEQDLTSIKVVKHVLRGCCLWYLAHSLCSNEKWIGLALIRAFGKGAFGVKHLDETVGPAYYSCPLSWLDECTEPNNDYARQWRETVRRQAQVTAEKKKRCRNFVAGQSVVYGGHTYTLVCQLPTRNWRVREVHSGIEYRMKSAQLASSILAEQQSLAA